MYVHAFNTLTVASLNTQVGFRHSGIYPFKKNVFSGGKFFPAALTDRPNLESNPPLYQNVDQVMEQTHNTETQIT